MTQVATTSSATASEIRLAFPHLTRGEHGYHADIARSLGVHFTKAVDIAALAEILVPLSDGSVLAVAHAVAARGNINLQALCQGSDLEEPARARILTFPWVQPKLVEEINQHSSALIERGKALGVRFVSSDLSLSEIETMLSACNVGLISLDWEFIAERFGPKGLFITSNESHLLRTEHQGAPLFYPVVPLVGYDQGNMLVHTYSVPYLSVPKEIFELARRNDRAERVLVFVTSGDLVASYRPVEVLLPLDTEKILQVFRIAERHEDSKEFWDDVIEYYTNGEDPCAGFLQRATEAGFSHQATHEIFHFVWNECQSRSPIWFHKLSTAMDKARLTAIDGAEFADFVKDVLKAVRTIRQANAVDEPMKPFEVLKRFEGLVSQVVHTVVSYEGPYKPKLKSTLQYCLMDLKAIEGPELPHETRAFGGDKVKVARKKPFEVPNLEHVASYEFKAVRPAQIGEPLYVSQVRMLVDWVETHGGEALRDCLIRSLSTGFIAIGGVTREIYTTPLHELADGIRAKLGQRTPYFIHELCLNHGLTAWKMIADYDAHVERTGTLPVLSPKGDLNLAYLRSDIWQFTARGLFQNIHEVSKVPASFLAELTYVGEILPWEIAGKVHPSYAAMIDLQFERKDHRLSDEAGEEILISIAQAKLYLEQLLIDESRLSHDRIWGAWSKIDEKDIRETIGKTLPTFLSTSELATFNTSWRSLVKLLHPDKMLGAGKSLLDFVNVFLEYGIARKKELEQVTMSEAG